MHIAMQARLFAGRKVRRRPLPRQRQPNAVRLAYATALLGILARARTLVTEMVVPELAAMFAHARQTHPERQDAESFVDYVDRAQRLFAQVAQRFFDEFTNEKLRRLALSMADRTSDQQRLELARQFRAVLGIDPMISEPWLGPRLASFASENAALIKTVPQRYFSEIEQRTVQALRTGTRAEDLVDEYSQRFGVSESRARLIARDQIGKLNGELNQTRQVELGVTRFTWRTSEDERVRPEHEDLDGQSFEWADPPSEGIPGGPINCRCTAEPDVQGAINAAA